MGAFEPQLHGQLFALTEPPEPVVKAPALPPRPLTDLAAVFRGDWFEGPPLDAQREAITIVRLRIGSHRRVDECTVTRSSGSADHDRRTCELIRASPFSPAENEAGKPVATISSYSHDWKTPRKAPRI